MNKENKKYSFNRASKFTNEYLYIMDYEEDGEYSPYEMRVFAENELDADIGVEEYFNILVKELNVTEEQEENLHVRLADSYTKIPPEPEQIIEYEKRNTPTR